MPSTLVFQGYQLHQKINDYQLPGFPVRWCHSKRKWKSGDNRIRAIYLKASIAIKLLTGAVICYIVFLAVHFPQHFQIVHKFVPGMTVCFIAMSISIDFIFLLYAAEIVGSCNFCIEAEILQFYREIDLYLSKSFKIDNIHGKIKLIKYTGIQF